MKQRLALPITLYPSRPRTVLYLAGCALVGAFGLAIEARVAAVVWVSICTLLFLGVGVRLMPSLAFLELTETGFSYRLGRAHLSVRWSDVARFEIREVTMRYGSTKYVEWIYVRRYEELPSTVGRRYTFGGGSGVLLDTFGLKAEELAELMNSLRSQYGHVAKEDGDG